MNPSEIPDFLRRARSSALFQRGTFKVGLSADNKPYLSIPATGESFTGHNMLQDAWEAIRAVGLKTREEIHPGVGRIPAETGSLYPQGWYRYPFLEGLANIWGKGRSGAFLARESYSNQPTSYDDFEDALRRGGIGIVDDDKSTILRLFENVGGKQQQASFDEVVKFLDEQVGLKITADAGDKVFKRLKALTSLRGYGSFEQGKSWKLGTFDPLSDEGPTRHLKDLLRREFGDVDDKTLKEMAEQGFEGMSVMRPSAVREIADDLDRQATQVLLAPGAGTWNMDSPEAIERTKMARTLREKASELRGMADEGRGRFNARIMGFDAYDGQLKGDILIGTERFFERWGKGDRQIITALTNLKKEVSLGKNVHGVMSRFISLEEHALRTQVFADIQTLSSMPFAFPQQDLDKFMRGTIDETMMQYLNDPDSSADVKGFRNALTSILESPVPDDVDAARKLRESQAYANQILEMQKIGVDVKEHPMLLNRFFANYQAWLKHSDQAGNPVPHYLLKDTASAAIVDSTSLRMADKGRLAKLPSGVLGFEGRSGSFALSTVDIPKYYEIFGGFDSDDYLNVMLRYDTSTRRIRALAYRQPNALGELGIFDTDSSVLRMFLKNKGIYDHDVMNPLLRDRDQLLKRLADINSKQKGLIHKGMHTAAAHMDSVKVDIENELAQIDNSLKATMDELDFSKMGSRIGFSADFQLTKLSTTLNGQTYANATEHIMKGMEDTGLRYLQLDKSKGAKAAFTLESVLENRRQAGMILGELGKYSNARMLLDTWINENDFHHLDVMTKSGKVEQVMKQFRVVTQETAIDSMINAVSRGGEGAFELSHVTEDIYRTLGKMVTLAQRNNVANKIDTGLDPYMLKYRVGTIGREQLRKGIQDAFDIMGITDEAPDLETLALADDHAKAFMSRYHIGFEGHLADIGDEARAAVEAAEYPSYVMDKYITPETRKQSQEFLDFYDRLLRTNLAGIDAGGDMDHAFKEMLDSTDDHSAAFSRIHRESMRYLADHFEDGVAGQKVHELLQGAMKIAAGPEGKFRWNYALFQHGRGLAEGLHIDDGVDLYQLSTQALMAAKAEAEGGPSKLTRDQREVLSRRYTVDQAMASAGPEPAGGFRASMRAVADDASERIIRPLKALDKAGLDDLFSVGIVKSGAVIAAGLIAFSAIYQSRRDVSPEEMQGPPLLPGGSFYEPATGPGVPYTNYDYNAPSGGGVTYKINARGDFDPSELMSQMTAISGAPVSGTASSAPPMTTATLSDNVAGVF